MRFRLFLSLLAQFFLLSSSLAQDSVIGYQGITGLFNMPSAMVINHGEFQFLYTDQIEANNRFGGNAEYIDGNSFNFGLGLFDNFEIVSRNLSRELDEGSDLSANIKLTIPYIPKDWLSLALGIQDFGGQANEYDGKYIVASKDFEYLSLSAGYGESLSTVGRMNGAMYGLSITPTPWLTALAEFDGADNNYGVRLSTPEQWLNHRYQLVFTWMASSSNISADQNKFFGLSLRMPLGTNNNSLLSSAHKKSISTSNIDGQLTTKSTLQNNANKFIKKSQPAPSNSPKFISTKIGSDLLNKRSVLAHIEKILSNFGFENTRVGENKKKIYVQFNNSIFNTNSIDALGFVLGVLSVEASDYFSEYEIYMQRNGITVSQVSGSINDYKDFLQGQRNRLPDMSIDVSPHNISYKDIHWYNEVSNSPYLTPRLAIKPSISTTLGTEYGVFDYSLALNIAAELPIWKGGVLSGSHNSLVDNSPDYEEFRIFNHAAKKTEWIDRYLSQAIALPYKFTTMFTAGEINRNNNWYQFGTNETKWNSESGRHQFGFKTGQYHKKNSSNYHSVTFGSYRYYWDEQDTNFKLTAGQYWKQDIGVIMEMSRFFGDTQIHLRFQDTDNQLIGIGVSIPLTPRKDMSPRGWQLKGSPNWKYVLSTRIDHTGSNPLSFGLADIAATSHNLDDSYYNFDRLSAAYIKRHPERLRDAYFQYIKN